MTVSSEDLAEAVLSPVHQALDNEGITIQKLAKLAKKELNSKTTRTVKIKGAVNGDELPRGFKKITDSGVIEIDDQGEHFGTGETLIEVSEINWTTRQKARINIHKLRGDYPAEKHDIKLNEESLNAILRGLPTELREAVIAELEQLISKRSN
jgi:hypothetical protein